MNKRNEFSLIVYHFSPGVRKEQGNLAYTLRRSDSSVTPYVGQTFRYWTVSGIDQSPKEARSQNTAEVSSAQSRMSESQVDRSQEDLSIAYTISTRSTLTSIIVYKMYPQR